MVQEFRIPFADHIPVGDLSSEPCSVLVLHGAGTSNRERFHRLRSGLHAEGVPTCSFDFIGHGETGGELGRSGLKERTLQASRVIDTCLQEPLTLIGASMSGYTAVKLTRLHEVKDLVLVVPAMYTPDAYEVPFNGGFSEIIRSHRSWERSDAWEILRGFRGRLLVVAAEHDSVIPREVVERILQSASQAQFRDLYIVRGASHVALLASAKEFRHVVGLIKSLIVE
jgi:pimeloyl-ACP methyl ester carboxylesterase